MRQLIRDGHFFHPETNIGNQMAIKRTQSCYLNSFTKKPTASRNVLPNTQYVQTSSGRTSYVTVPNRSKKILQKATNEEPLILTRQDPLGLMTEPMRSLKGPLLTEMIFLNKQKNRGLGRKNKTIKEPLSRHSKLKEKIKLDGHTSDSSIGGHNKQLTAQRINEDLFISPVDEYMRKVDLADKSDSSTLPTKTVGTDQTAK